jgi:hypothetical protein
MLVFKLKMLRENYHFVRKFFLFSGERPLDMPLCTSDVSKSKFGGRNRGQNFIEIAIFNLKITIFGEKSCETIIIFENFG